MIDREVAMIRGDELQESIDIRDAVYLRMAPEGVRDELKHSRSTTDEIESRIFERMFPSMTEKAVFWYQAGKGRGIVLCDGPSITYVPQASLEPALRRANTGCRSKAQAALARYDPLREAVIAVIRGEFSGIAVTGAGATDPVLQLME
jgi:hypothetical protein